MKLTVKYKTKTGGWKLVRCGACKEPRIFQSWKSAKEFADKRWKHTRITRIDRP